MTQSTQTGIPTEQQLERINRFTRKALAADQVYVFSVTLCDNDVDRDHERFTNETLEQLAPMFVGKTGIFDHSMKAGDQCARIFDCEVVTDTSATTATGEAYRSLKAYAYIPRGAGFDNIIAEIDAGIKKEVSVSCTVEKRLCSICGADQNVAPCGHLRGKYYQAEGKRKSCYLSLDTAVDAYEWSFVAVPAQKKAGVTKSHVYEEGVGLTDSALQALKSKAEAGEMYIDQLKSNAVKYSLLVNPALTQKAAWHMVDGMDLHTLIAFESDCKAAACAALPMQPQLTPAKETKSGKETHYLI